MSWRILQQWFNAPPRKQARYISDKFGKKFWIYWGTERFERAAELHLSYYGRCVGIINSLREKDGSITLADVRIVERYELRERGLGKAMIQEFIRWAQANNFNRIGGFIKAQDGSTVEYLTEWYKRPGFKVKDRQIFFEIQGNP